MRKSIESYEHYFNVDELNKDIKLVNDLIKKYQLDNIQINVKHCGNQTEKDQLLYCANSMWTNKFTEMLASQSDFNNIIDVFKNTYTAEVIKQVEQIAAGDNISIGRARFMSLRGKSTLTYHRDIDGSIVRYHIPVITSDSAFFIVENELFQMNTPGRLYDIIPTRRHTAINASRDTRWHLVLDGYIKLNARDYEDTHEQHPH